MSVYGPYRALVKDVHDGDTCGLDIDLGFKHEILTRNPITGEREFTCRIYGINAPELATQAGKEALAFLLSIMPPGTQVQVYSHSWDAYQGRYDGEIHLPDGTSVAEAMLRSGHAIPFTP